MDKLKLSNLLPSGADYQELKQQESRTQAYVMLDGILIRNSVSSNGGLMARAFNSGVWGLASSPLMNGSACAQVMRQAVANAGQLAGYYSKNMPGLPSNPASGAHLLFTPKPRWTTAEKIALITALDEYIRQHCPKVSSRTITLAQDDTEKNIVCSAGGEMHTMIPRSILYIMLVINTDANPVQHWDVFGGCGEIEDIIQPPEHYYPEIDRIYRQLLDKLDAVEPRGGNFDCVLASKLAGILAHEAIGHTTEADFVLNGSIAGEYLHQAVASPLVNLLDVAHTWQGKMCPVPVFIDDECTAAEDCLIIENGVLQRYMHNKESAALLGHQLTGNARAYAYGDEPLIRMRNTMIVPGTSQLEDMIASIEDGYYLVESSNGQADATSEFMFGIGLGYEIKHGKLGKAIKETTISGMGGPAIKCRVNMGGV